MVISTNATIVCLQETKIAHWSSQLVAETLGQQFAHSFATLTANGIRGGILLGVSENYFAIQNHHATAYTISTDVPMKADNTTWTITGVYGPQDDNEKCLFLEELRGLKARAKAEWLVLGDFNLIYQAADKSNNRLNRRDDESIQTSSR
jgi:exonuclease III